LAPFGVDEPLPVEAVQRLVERGIFDGEVAVGALVNERGNPVTVHWSGGEGAEHEEVEGALDERERRRFRHASP
jgi:hypothetical protein